jgi:hypothetical protein
MTKADEIRMKFDGDDRWRRIHTLVGQLYRHLRQRRIEPGWQVELVRNLLRVVPGYTYPEVYIPVIEEFLAKEKAEWEASPGFRTYGYSKEHQEVGDRTRT